VGQRAESGAGMGGQVAVYQALDVSVSRFGAAVFQAVVRLGEPQPAPAADQGGADAEVASGKPLTYLRHPVTNAVTEGLNSKVQMIKSNARGFRSFDNYRIRILFFCGKLDLYPL